MNKPLLLPSYSSVKGCELGFEVFLTPPSLTIAAKVKQ